MIELLRGIIGVAIIAAVVFIVYYTTVALLCGLIMLGGNIPL